MKTLAKTMNLKMFFSLLVFNLVQLVVWAQEETTTTTSTRKVDIEVSNNENWYAAPWVWIVAAALFILLLVALLGGNRTRTGDRVTTTRTVDRDTDI
jgi:cytochrome bd-type quinol oxidase subunit 2